MTIKGIQWFVLLTTTLYIALSVLAQVLHLRLLDTVYLNELFFLGMGLLFLWRHRLPVSSFIRLDVPPIGSFLVATLAVFCTVYIGGFLTAISMLFTRLLGLPDLPEQILTQATDQPLLLVLSLAILPGVAEEFYCRGTVLRSMLHVTTKWQSVLYAGLVFGLFHFHPWNFLSPVFMGIVFAILALRYDSVIIAMYSHALFNLLVLISNRAVQGVDRVEVQGGTLLAMLPITLLAGFVLWLFYKKLGIAPMMQSERASSALRSYWPSGLLILLFVLMTMLIYVDVR